MVKSGAFGKQLGDRFGVPEVPTLVTTTLNKTQVAVTLVESEILLPVMNDPLPCEDAYLVHLNLRACPDHEIWIDGKALGKRTFREGETAIHDLRQSTVARIYSPIGSLMFYLSRALLDEICLNSNVPTFTDLNTSPGVSVDDPVISGLGQVLTQAMKRPFETSTIFVDHITLALAAHVATKYGSAGIVRLPACGGLARWQEKRAKELLATNIDGNITMACLANECGMSVRHFTRSFSHTVGQPPYRWLNALRVERSKSLLREKDISLSEIAIVCGFYDQSHFSRCFKNAVGMTPGAWRRYYQKGHSFRYD